MNEQKVKHHPKFHVSYVLQKIYKCNVICSFPCQTFSGPLPPLERDVLYGQAMRYSRLSYCLRFFAWVKNVLPIFHFTMLACLKLIHLLASRISICTRISTG